VDRSEKRALVATLQEVFAKAAIVVVIRNDGMTVAESRALRIKMRQANAVFRITPNRLARLALDGTRFDGVKALLKGPIAFAWSADPVAAAKVAVEFAKTNEKFVPVGGALGTRMLDVDGLKALADLPSLDTLRAGLVGMISTPATRIVSVLQAPAGQIARVLRAYADKQQEAA
jgi:large subunit ribosomal protein L10